MPRPSKRAVLTALAVCLSSACGGDAAHEGPVPPRAEPQTATSVPGEREEEIEAPPTVAEGPTRPSMPEVDPCTVEAQVSRQSGNQESDVTILPPAEELEQGGRTLRVGARVRLNRRARAVAEAVTAHARSIALGPGQVGTILCFVRTHTPAWSHTSISPVVRWDAQTWTEWSPLVDRMETGRVYDSADINAANAEHGPTVSLGTFWTSQHGEVLDLIDDE